MANFLDSLGLGGGTHVYVSILPTNKIEMCVPDKNGYITAYAHSNIDFNEIGREIGNYEEFKNKISELFNTCSISAQNANVHVCIPTVWFGYKDGIQFSLEKEAIDNIVIGELEQAFIFKRSEPIPYWFEAQTQGTERAVFYTAIQENAVTQIRESLKALGANLVSIDCSLFAYLRALYATGKITTLIDTPNTDWALVVVNNNGYQVYNMRNAEIISYNEEPIILSSYSAEELYTQIADSLQVNLVSSPAKVLTIISETEQISAQRLADFLHFGGDKLACDENNYRTQPLVPEICTNLDEESQISVSLSIIGTYFTKNTPWQGANFVPDPDLEDAIKIPIGGKVFLLTPKKALTWSLLLLIVVLLIMLTWFAIEYTNHTALVKKDQELTAQLNQVNSQLAQFEEKKPNAQYFDAVKETERVLKNNRTKIMSYAALGESIPQNLYLTYFMTGSDGYVDIQGCANTVEDVYIFFQNLKDSLIESKLRLNKLDLKAGSLDSVINNNVSAIDTAPYVFEITNMSEGQLASFMKALSDPSAKQNSSDSEQQAEPSNLLPPPNPPAEEPQQP